MISHEPIKRNRNKNPKTMERAKEKEQVVREEMETEKKNAVPEEITEEPEAPEEPENPGNRGWTASSDRRFF